MIKQIKTDENGVIQMCSIGGKIDGGTDVEFIPDEVMKCPAKWVYYDGRYAENPNYQPPEPPAPEITTEELALAVTELAETAANDNIEIKMAIAELAEVILNG